MDIKRVQDKNKYEIKDKPNVEVLEETDDYFRIKVMKGSPAFKAICRAFRLIPRGNVRGGK